MMTEHPRLIEVAFPLKQASLDSVHEKNVRHGHISTLHIWPARRPLAACRAALIATLLPDPGNDEERRQLLERIGGKVVRTVEKKQQGNRTVEVVKEETEGGILHWGREDWADMAWFREEICKAYGGRPPRVLDPFAGGGAIPLEAMRLGCEVTAVDINPVAWFLLKCTLEYPQRLAGQVRPLPKFAVESREFMQGFFKGTGVKGRRQLEKSLESVQQGLFPPPDVDLPWHVRAWGWWVLQRAQANLAPFYPIVDDKPVVAYLWARTVSCKNCRATVPLLKTRWLCKKERKRVVLTMKPNADRTGVVFSIQNEVPVAGGNAAQRRENDRQVGCGTMSRSGASCPCCGTISTTEDIRLEGQAGRLGSILTAVVVDGKQGKEYRLPTAEEREATVRAVSEVDRLFADIPYGNLNESIPKGGSRAGGGSPFTVVQYGLTRWHELFTPRQLLANGVFVKCIRAAIEMMRQDGYPPEWAEAIGGLLYCTLARLADRNSQLCTWQVGAEKIGHTFARFALPITWDFVEVMPWADSSGGFGQAVEWVALVCDHLISAARGQPRPLALRQSAKEVVPGTVDIIITDPPYYDAIPYSDLMDFFYLWLRRTLHGLVPILDEVFQASVGPKWDTEQNDGELIDDSSRHAGDATASKNVYEEGMFHVFQACHKVLAPDGRLGTRSLVEGDKRIETSKLRRVRPADRVTVTFTNNHAAGRPDTH